MYIDYEKIFGWGVVIYAIMFLLWSGFISYGFVDTLGARLVGLAVLAAIMYRAGRALNLHTWENILPYSLGWVIVVGVMDMILSVPFAGWDIFLDPNLWISYAVIAIVPLFVVEDVVSPGERER